MLPRKVIQFLQTFEPRFPVRLWKACLLAAAAFALIFPALIWIGWLRIPPIPFFNDMAWQAKAKAQSLSPVAPDGVSLFPDGVILRPPVPGTIPRDYQPYPYDPAALGEEVARKQAGENLINPLPPRMENLRHGERMYDNYCQPCHGYRGMADGSAVGVGRLTAPNSLHTDTTRNYTDGEMYHIITVGQKNMPGYAWQMSPLDRWASVHYVRVLQRAVNPLPEDIPTTGSIQTAIPAEDGDQSAAQDAPGGSTETASEDDPGGESRKKSADRPEGNSRSGAAKEIEPESMGMEPERG